MRELTYGWNIEMQMRAAKAGLRILEIPVDYYRRSGGDSKVAGSLSGTIRAERCGSSRPSCGLPVRRDVYSARRSRARAFECPVITRMSALITSISSACRHNVRLSGALNALMVSPHDDEHWG